MISSTVRLHPEAPPASAPGWNDLPPTSTLLSRKIDVISLRHDGRERLLDHIALQTPALITDLAAGWPALRNWTPERLIARFGDKAVRVYDATFGDPGANYMNSIATMPFAEFLKQTLGEGRDLRMFLFNIGRQIPELLGDVQLPDVGLHFSKRFIHVFCGCRGATTPLHYDIDMGCVFHTTIRGRRRVRLFGPEQSRALYQHPFTVRSYTNLDEPDYDTFPALARGRGYEVVLETGHTLFMPSGYWHEFHYADAGIGLSLRAMSPRLRDRVLGAANLLALSPIDRLGNVIAADRWFEWKRRRAEARALIALRLAERTK